MERRRTVWLLVMALAVPLFGPAIAEWILRRTKAGKRQLFNIFWGLFIAQLIIGFYVGLKVFEQIQALNQTKDNLHAVQLAIEKWRYDNNYENIPDTLDDLVAKKYLTKLPMNPYTDNTIRVVALDSKLSQGDINYLPVYNISPDKSEYSCSFALICYGPNWYNDKYHRKSYLPPHVLINLDLGGDLYGYTDDNGDGVFERARSKSGSSCPDIIKVYRGEKIRGWVTAENYRRLRAQQPKAFASP